MNNDMIKKIANVFIGNEDEIYEYKTGSQLIDFFNQYFGYNNTYNDGVPTRWTFVHDRLLELTNIDDFFNIILSKEYCLLELKVTEVEAVEKCQQRYNRFNTILRPFGYKISKKGKTYNLVEINDDLELIGSGGFADVYLEKSTGYAVKQLNDESMGNPGARSRFKREYEIMKELAGNPRVLEVVDFDEGSCSYRMERADMTLREFIENDEPSEEEKIGLCRRIVNILSDIHAKDIIHRDLSPTNIFFVNNKVKIGDFGLGKDLNKLASHKTTSTKSYGQYMYTDPRQLVSLKEGDKQSDVYSLGILLNFIMTKNPGEKKHIFRLIVEKCTNTNLSHRFRDASEMKNAMEKIIAYRDDLTVQEKIVKNIKKGQWNDEVEVFLSTLTKDEICKHIMTKTPGFQEALCKFMSQDEERSKHVMNDIEKTYVEVCRTFEAYDPFAEFASAVLRLEGMNFIVQELAARILHYIAYDVNRFSAQKNIEEVLDAGIEPLLEDVLKAS